MAVQEDPAIMKDQDIYFDEHQALKDLMNSTETHPIDSFFEEMTSKEWDIENTQVLISSPSPMTLPPLPHVNAALPSTAEARRMHKRTVTMDEASAEKITLTAEDWKIGVEQLLDIKPTPVSELMQSELHEPIQLFPAQVPPSPPASAVLTPSPPPPLALPEEMPMAMTAPTPAVAAEQVITEAPISAFEPFAAPSTFITAPENAPIPAPRTFPSYSCPVAPKPINAKRGRKKEAQVVEYVDEPTDLDCVLGRGGKSNHHPGNRRYRTEVQNLQKWYKSSGKAEKTELAQCLVNYVQSYGGRFVKQEKRTGRWYVVSNLVARRKASQALREHMTMEERAAKKAAALAAAGMSTE